MRPIHAAGLATVVALAGCGGDAGPATKRAPSPTTTRSDTAQQPSRTAPATGSASASASATDTATGTATQSERTGGDRVLKTAASEFGTMLFDGKGQAIYLFDRETTSSPECYDACAEAWPPVLLTGTPRATGRVRSRLLGTVGRTDGSTQVTYAGHPLYYYAHEGRNEVLCHNVTEFGGRWLVVTPSGEPAA